VSNPRKVLRFAGLGGLLWLSLATLPVPSRGEPTKRSANAVRTEPTPLVGIRHIQRTMRLLAESRPALRHTVRVLFYGQSITEQRWSAEVERALRARFPHANLEIENRALGGYHAQLLVKAAETDLYPFYPDLLIFHVYGAHDKYADLIRRTRERTTAEILLQTDHLTKLEELHEPVDAAHIQIDTSPWSTFMNQRWLPEVAKRYQTALCDQRAAWKRHLAQQKLAPAALLADEIHLNARGEALMAACVNDCLRRDATRDPPDAEQWVRLLDVGRDVRWHDDVLKAEFVGNRVDAAFARRGRRNASPDASRELALGSQIAVTIDGRPPSEWQELYGFTRALPTPGGKWPAVLDIGSRTPLRPERWTLLMTTLSREPERYSFELHGSLTGQDGRGRSDQPFVSRSGRIVLEPDDWTVAYALALVGTRPVPDHFSISWDVVPRGVDRFEPPIEARAGVEPAVTLAQGLPSGRHVLELRGRAPELRGLRIYRPPLGEPGGAGAE